MRPTIALVLVWLMLTACTAPVAAPTNIPFTVTQPPTATLAPSPTSAPTATLMPALVTIITQTIQDSGQSPTYTLTANLPQVVGADAFNVLATTLVNEEITLFKEGVLTMPPVPDGYGSFLDISFDVTSAEPRAFSVLVGISGYVDGAAHPYHYARVLNYDLVLDHALELADVFTPDSDYLGRIAGYCLQELQTREFVDNLAGAAPTEANYAVWNITPDGLLITFNEYQVAAYAAGAQTVNVPSAAVRDLIAPNGPLGTFIQ